MVEAWNTGVFTTPKWSCGWRPAWASAVFGLRVSVYDSTGVSSLDPHFVPRAVIDGDVLPAELVEPEGQHRRRDPGTAGGHDRPAEVDAGAFEGGPERGPVAEGPRGAVEHLGIGQV